MFTLYFLLSRAKTAAMNYNKNKLLIIAVLSITDINTDEKHNFSAR